MAAAGLIEIDGATGEGGGQILRTSLALSAITGKPFRLYNVRGNRPKPGLRRQHMTAVLAAAEVCGGRVRGAVVDSREVIFEPGAVRAGDYRFDIGSAGSTMLVLQTVLPALMIAEGASSLVLEGGTHNFGAPPLDFLCKTFLPMIARMGPQVDLRLERAGFAPAGGGRATVKIRPAPLRVIEILERGEVRHRQARATVAGLPREIAERELRTVAGLLSLKRNELVVEELPADQGPGNIVAVEVQTEALTEMFTAFGARGIRGEDVARDAAGQAEIYLKSGAPVGEHLSDQLLLPMALAGGGGFVTGRLSLHATTNIETIGRFLPEVRIEARDAGEGRVKVEVG